MPISTYGQSVSFTVIVSSSSGPTPTGTVQFVVDSVNFGGYRRPRQRPGHQRGSRQPRRRAHAIDADYLGDTNYAATSATFTQVVNKAHLAVVPDNLSQDQSASPTPHSRPTSPASFSARTPATANVTGSPTLATTATTASPVGAYPITVVSAGHARRRQLRLPAASFGLRHAHRHPGHRPRASSSGSTVPTSTYGQSVSYTVTVNPPTGGPTPTGTVQFVVDGVELRQPCHARRRSSRSPAATIATLGAGTPLGRGQLPRRHQLRRDHLGQLHPDRQQGAPRRRPRQPHQDGRPAQPARSPPTSPASSSARPPPPRVSLASPTSSRPPPPPPVPSARIRSR